MPNQGEILSFYAIEDQDSVVRVFESPVPITSQTALWELNRVRTQEGKKAFAIPPLRVCYDVSSKRLYLPEYDDVTQGLAARRFDAIRLEINQNYGGFAGAPPLHGDPLALFRIRKASEFPVSWRFIQRLTDGRATDIPVVEADLSKMPTTCKQLQVVQNQFQGRFVGAEDYEIVQFMIGNDSSKDILCHAQRPPFILINLSKDVFMSSATKERVIITGYREGLGSQLGDVQVGEMTGSQFYALEFLIYSGWPMDHICRITLDGIKDIHTLQNAGDHIVAATKHMGKIGFRDISEPPFYYAFRAGPAYPENELSQGVIRQVTHDNTGWVVIASNIWLSDEQLISALDARGEIIHAKLELTMSAFMFRDKVNDFQQQAPNAFRKMCSKAAADIWGAGHGLPGQPRRAFSVGIEHPNAKFFQRRRLSDYPQAEDTLKLACAKLSRSEGYPIAMDDLEVVVGPWSSMYGMRGGYLQPNGVQSRAEEEAKGIFIYPPAILVDTDSFPTAADQTGTLIHEYWHHIYFRKLKRDIGEYQDQDPNGKDVYNQEEKNRRWEVYLNNPTERLSHIQQMKYMLARGMSKAEVLMYYSDNKLPGPGDLVQYRKRAELVDEAYKELQQEFQDDINPGATESSQHGT